MNKVTIVALSFALACSLSQGAAFAKGGTPQNHHCVKDGAPMPDKTKKQCKQEGGKWEKDADAAKPADGAKTPAGK